MIKRQVWPGRPLPTIGERERALRANLGGDIAEDAAQRIVAKNKSTVHDPG